MCDTPCPRILYAVGKLMIISISISLSLSLSLPASTLANIVATSTGYWGEGGGGSSNGGRAHYIIESKVQ